MSSAQIEGSGGKYPFLSGPLKIKIGGKEKGWF
jgi:hypothetical protein